MELYKRLIEIVDANLIHYHIPMILTLMVVELIYKNRFQTRKTLNLIRWTILVYTIITGAITLIGIARHPESSLLITRGTEPYKLAYWIMFLFAVILPFTLLTKKLASKFWYVLLVAFCMKIGFYFERFVIVTTNFHRDGADEFINST